MGGPAHPIVIDPQRILLGSRPVQVQRVLLALRQLPQDRLHFGAPRLQQRLSMVARHDEAPASAPSGSQDTAAIIGSSVRRAVDDGRRKQCRDSSRASASTRCKKYDSASNGAMAAVELAVCSGWAVHPRRSQPWEKRRTRDPNPFNQPPGETANPPLHGTHFEVDGTGYSALEMLW